MTIGAFATYSAKEIIDAILCNTSLTVRRSAISVSYVEREQADEATLAFYDKAEERFEMLLNIFKVFGHTAELGSVFTEKIIPSRASLNLPARAPAVVLPLGR